MAKLVAETYADALFEAGGDLKKLDEFYQEYQALITIIEDQPRFFELIKTPKIDGEEKKQILTNVFAGRLSEEMLNFIKVLIDKRRSAVIKEIFKAFEARYREHKRQSTAYVSTVKALTDQQAKTLQQNLSQITGYQVTLETTINPALVGGMMIKIGDQIIDQSVRRQLNDMRELLIDRVV